MSQIPRSLTMASFHLTEPVLSYEGEVTSRPTSQQQQRPLLSPSSAAASSPSPLARYLCHSESNLSQLSAAGAALSLVSAAEAETVTAKVSQCSVMSRTDRKSQVRQCLGFCAADP